MTTIEEALRLSVKSILNVTHTAFPGVIVAYDYQTQKATVQPSIRKKYQNSVVQDMPVLNAVPLCFQRSSSSGIAFPISPGDRVLVICMERSLDEWINTVDSQVTPQDPRQFHLSDAIAIPGLYPFTEPLVLENNDDFVISHAGSTITIRGDGEIDIKTASKVAIGTATTEVLQVLSDTLDLLTSITAVPAIPAGGSPPQPLNIATAAGVLKTQLDLIKGTIT